MYCHLSDLDVQKLAAATKLAPGKVRLALSLVGYPEEVANAMTFVFGNTLICDDAESAKLVTFSPQVGGVRSVTLDGDIYDPSGTLSGGSAPSSSGVLVKVQELLEAERRLGEARGRLEMLEREEERGRVEREKWKKLARELEIKEHEMHLLEEQVGGSNATRVCPNMMWISLVRLTAGTGWRRHREDKADDCRSHNHGQSRKAEAEGCSGRDQEARERYGRV